MTTPIELKENLIKQYNDLIGQIQRIEGAIAACDQLAPADDTSVEEEEE